MRKSILLLWSCIAMTASAQFTEGNLVVFRIGDGAATLRVDNTGNPAFLDEYTTAGVLVQSIAIPTTDNGSNKAFVSRYGLGEGLLNRSADGRYLLIPGYNANVGGTTDVELIGRIDYFENLDLTTTFNTSGTFNSVISDDGTNLWMVASDQIQYTTLGGTSVTGITPGYGTAVRDLGIYNNQLYASTANSIASIGTGKPTTTGQTFNNLPGSINGNFYQFVMFDMSPSEPGPDVLYAADQNGTIDKYSLVSGSWVANGTISGSNYIVGLTGTATGNSATLYLVQNASFMSSGGGTISTLTDASGHNATISGSLTTLATAATNTSFRGIAFSPTQFVLPVKFIRAGAVAKGNAAEISWTVATDGLDAAYEIQRSVNGRDFTIITSFTSAGEEHRYTDLARPAGKVYYRIKATEPGGTSVFSKIFQLEGASAAMEISLLPVQQGRLFVQVSHAVAGKYKMNIVNAAGQILRQEERQLVTGSNTAEVLVNQLPAGVYFLVLDGPSKSSYKFMVQ